MIHEKYDNFKVIKRDIMQYIRTILLFICIYVFANAKAQLSTNEKPVSFDRESELALISRSSTPIVTTPKLDMAKIEKEDEEDKEYDMPPRFGYSHIVNYDLNNSGTWYKLPNGGKLWQLEVVCPAALSVNFCYDKFWIPEGGKFFVYSKDRKHTIGAFTSRNNKGDKVNIRGFATGLVYGDDVVLEYYQPKEVTSDAIISLKYVVHGYRYINGGQRSFGESCSYMVNVNCSEGMDWQNEKKAVALMIVDGTRWCTGALLITTDLEQKPYFLTANHCLGVMEDNHYVVHDAVTSPDLDLFSFYWNYETPGCDTITVEPPYDCTNAATVVANNSYSDFALLRLSEDPKNLSNFTPYYLGWDSSGDAGDPGVCIHHPKGDVKKISTVKDQPVSVSLGDQPIGSNSHWKVYWKQTPHGHGVTQEGSSGSPLLTAKHKVIGQLHASTCNDCMNLNGHSIYGKFNLSWTGNNNTNIYRRLNCWLDSLNTGVQTMEGLHIISSDSIMNTNHELYSNILIMSTGQLTIQSDIEMMGNSKVIVESGGSLIISGGVLSNADLVLKPNATLRILNNGIIETRNGFEAPVGAIVEIRHGQIL